VRKLLNIPFKNENLFYALDLTFHSTYEMSEQSDGPIREGVTNVHPCGSEDSSVHEETDLVGTIFCDDEEIKSSHPTNVRSSVGCYPSRKWLCVLGCALAHFVLGK
jgi:hypothetical protein